MAKPPAVYHEHQLLRFQDCSNDVEVAAGTTSSISVIAGKPLFTIYVRKISGCVTAVAAGALTFQDTANTPKVVGAVASSASLGGVTVLDAYGKGIALTEGKGLSLVGAAAGPAGVYYIEAYYYPSSPDAI